MKHFFIDIQLDCSTSIGGNIREYTILDGNLLPSYITLLLNIVMFLCQNESSVLVAIY